MQETPPHSLLEIKLLLSRYLDGDMQPAEVAEVDSLMSRFPQYVQELRKLQKTRETLQSTLEEETWAGTGKKGRTETWKNISKKLKADKKGGVAAYDAEFVSAYYDGEIPAASSEFIEFESQLFYNQEANELLASLGDVSEAVRQLSYRLESNCTLDITQSVMAAFLAEQSEAVVAGDSTDSETLDVTATAEQELISAYADQALTPREIIEVNRLIESNHQARRSLSHFNQISEMIQGLSAQIQAKAPDCWPNLAETLAQSPENGGLVVPMDRYRTAKRLLKIAGPMAAAVLLVVLLMPPGKPPAGPLARTIQVAQKPSAPVVPVAGAEAIDKAEIATVPANGLMNREGIQATLVSNHEDAAGPVRPTMAVRYSGVNAGRDLADAPFSSAKARIASRPQPMVQTDLMAAPPAPSSEEYLFNALSEQMPGEDVSSILGK